MKRVLSAGRRWYGVVGAVALLAGCGGDDSSSASTVDASISASTVPSLSTSAVVTTAALEPSSTAPTTTASTIPPTSAIPPTVPAGTVLRIADQYGLFQGVLGFAGEDRDIPYEVQYATLSPGPTQLQAFQAGEVDLGVVSPLGLIQAAAGDVDVHAVARWRTDFALFALVTAPGVEGIADWADLQGKQVAFQRNTMGEALVLLALDRLGLSLEDITVVDIPQHLVTTALQGGDADAGVTSEPFVSAYLEANPTATYVLGVEEPAAQSTLVVASGSALADDGLSAAVAEYVTRLDRAFTELTSDREQFAALAVQVWNLDRDYVDRVLEHSNGVRMDAVPGDLLDPYRRLAELLAARGDVPADLDVTAMFDDRFSGLLAG